MEILERIDSADGVCKMPDLSGEWAPEGFDPEEFDLDEINAALRFTK